MLVYWLAKCLIAMQVHSILNNHCALDNGLSYKTLGIVFAMAGSFESHYLMKNRLNKSLIRTDIFWIQTSITFDRVVGKMSCYAYIGPNVNLELTEPFCIIVEGALEGDASSRLYYGILAA